MLRTDTIVTTILASICVALAGVVAFEFANPPVVAASGDADIEAITQRSGGLAEFTARPLSDFSHVLARPLFFEDRRLPQTLVEEAPVQSDGAQPLRLTLEGVAISGDLRVALLRDASDRAQIRLTQGMTHNGWTLENVDSKVAEFRRGTDVETLVLDARENTQRRAVRRRR